MIDIKKASEEDIDEILDIENTCFISPWSKKNLIDEINENPISIFYVLFFENKIVGFIDYWITFDSATIAQIAIKPEFRKNGFASKLLQLAIDDCHEKDVLFMTLEVRENNKAAINLYNKFGFENILIKEKYYTNGDNAIYMMRKVC